MFTLACAHAARGCRFQLSQAFLFAFPSYPDESCFCLCSASDAERDKVVRPVLVAVAPSFLVKDIFEKHFSFAAGELRLAAAGCASTVAAVVGQWFAAIALQGRRFRA